MEMNGPVQQIRVQRMQSHLRQWGPRGDGGGICSLGQRFENTALGLRRAEARVEASGNLLLSTLCVVQTSVWGRCGMGGLCALSKGG